MLFGIALYIFRAVAMRIVISCDVLPCSLLDIYRRFREKHTVFLWRVFTLLVTSENFCQEKMTSVPKTTVICVRKGIHVYTGCPRMKGPNFGRVFLRSNYTDITQNTYIQSLMVTETLNIEKWGLVWCLRKVLCPWRHTSRIRSCIPTLSLDAAHCDLGYDQMLAVYTG